MEPRLNVDGFPSSAAAAATYVRQERWSKGSRAIVSRLADPVNLIMTTKGSRGKQASTAQAAPLALPPSFVGAEKNCVTRCAKCKNAKKGKS